MTTRSVGRYEIIREVGRGGMAIVHLARQRDLDRFVALKELAGFHASDPSFAQRFVRESRVAGSLSHPNVVGVHDYFEWEGTPFIAMEYVERGSLRPWVGHLSPPQIFGVLEGLLAGLTCAEQAGIVHRDLKPENLMVTADGRVKIADFGIAKARNRMQTGAFMTATGTTVGTPSYMAPEQAMAQDIGPWTDLYSVGVMAYELFVGRTPFHETEAPVALLLRHVNDPIPPARSVAPDVPQEISDWIDGLLVKAPAERTQSGLDAWDALEDLAITLLGPRWRREARLTGEAQHLHTPRPLTPAPFASGEGPATPPPGAAAVPAAESAWVTFGVGAAIPAPAPPRPEPEAPVPVAETAAPPAPASAPPAPAPVEEPGFETFAPGRVAPGPEPVAEPEPEPDPEPGPEPQPGPVAEPELESAPAFRTYVPPEPRRPEPPPPAEAAPQAPAPPAEVLVGATVAPEAVPPAPPPSEPPGHDAEPARDGGGRAFPIAIAVGVVLAAMVGFLVAGSGGDDAQEPPTLSAGGIALRAPAGWREDPQPDDVPDLPLQDAVAATDGPARVVAGLAEPGTASLMPDAFLATLGDEPPSGRPVRLNARVQAVRYDDLAPAGLEGRRVRLFAAPTDAGVAMVVCQQAPATECDRTAASLAFDGPKPLPVGADAVYAESLNPVLAALGKAGSTARSELRAARRPDSQGTAAAKLGRAYGTAVTALAKLEPAPVARAGHDALLAALTQERDAYTALGKAARGGDRTAYRRASAAVRAGQRSATRALATLEAAGYRTG